MPVLKSIAISNFKGASSVQIDFRKHVNCPVTTLIGLNESGKTTLLEAMSYFVTGDNAVSSLFSGTHAKPSVDGIIPIHRKAAFTGSIEVSAPVVLDDEDIEAVSKELSRIKYRLQTATFPREVEVSRRYQFEDSVLKEWYNNWELEFSAAAQSGKSKKVRSFFGPREPGEKAKDPWDVATTAIERRMPRIAYFPTFLVDLPQRIYLGQHTEERAVNRYYRTVFQDVLDSLSEGLSLDKHVCKRIEDAQAKDSINWLSIFLASTAKDQVDAVFQKLSSAITREVLGSWERVFQRKISAKSISIDWGIDTQRGNLPYASFHVSDGESKYAINERSLGFRWFFSFLLFTAFKRTSSRPTLFLFDEPAANLHAKAQAELLTSFAKITTGDNRIVYSTHSHHMINPRWLSGAYIVENTAIDHDSEDAFGLSTKPTNVIAKPYRQFVAQYPTRTSYFQPVLEKLEYVVPELVGSGPFLVVEGITDYYALKIAQRLLSRFGSFSIMPSTGAGASDPTISSCLGRGEQFILLLDDDAAGRRNRSRYLQKWFLSEELVITLKEVDSKFERCALESLISSAAKSAMSQYLEKAAIPTKKEIGWYLAELCSAEIGTESSALDKETLGALETVLSYVDTQFRNFAGSTTH